MADLGTVSRIAQQVNSPSRVELISTNGAVVSAFALTRFTMAAVVLGTLIITGLETEQTALFFVQFAAAAASVVAVAMSLTTLVRRIQKRPVYATHPWSLIVLDSVLAIGVMAVIDADTSPLAWVALITPVLETAVLFSMTGAGFVWLGLSLAFLAVRLITGGTDDAAAETLALSIQQVLAVLFVSGPAALMADSAQQRIDNLAEARRSSDQTSERLRRIAQSANQMSQLDELDDILGAAAESAAAIGFDQADIVVRDSSNNLQLHSSDSIGPAEHIPLEILSAYAEDGVASITVEDSEWGDALRLNGIASGHGFVLSNRESAGAVLRVWSKRNRASDEDVRALALLGGHARETYRATELLKKAQTHADQLQYEVRHDALTGLANRAFVLETLEKQLSSRQPTALFFIDLDGFKAVNDTLGHRAGDDALVAVADRLRATGRDGELAGRMGGDEFILLTPLTPFDTIEVLQSYGEEIVRSLSEPMIADGNPAQLGASVGIAVHDGIVGPDQLISLADDAMYEAKRQGGGTKFSPNTANNFSDRQAS